jgi:hypothetical protein
MIGTTGKRCYLRFQAHESFLQIGIDVLHLNTFDVGVKLNVHVRLDGYGDDQLTHS